MSKFIRVSHQRYRGDHFQGSPTPNRRRRTEGTSESERGAILILALAYIVVVSVIVAALTTWATNDLNNTTKFVSARSMDYAASSAVQVAINSIRYTTLVGPNETLGAKPPSYCWGTSATAPSTLTTDNVDIAVWCSTQEDLGSSSTRTVTFYACKSAVLSAACAAAPLLQAIVVFDDYPQGSSAPLSGQCSKYCGVGALLESWDWGSLAGTSTGLSANEISVVSTPPTLATVGSTYVTNATATSGDPVVVSSGSGGICTVASGVVDFIADGTCTVNFNDAGNTGYLAASQVQQTISVGQHTNTITVTSSAPTGSVEGGPTYTPVATASSGDAVVVTSATPSTCAVAAGVVSFIDSGTCTIYFNDPGNTDYSAAVQVQQTISVALPAPAGADVQGVPSPQDGKPDNGDSIQYIYNQTMTPSSLLSGFTGASTSVYVQLSRSSGSSTNLVVCSTNTCSTVVNLGTVSLGDSSSTGYYVSPGGFGTVTMKATMVMSTVSGESIVTVTLGTVVSGTVNAIFPAAKRTTIVWTPSALATSSSGGIACATGAVTQSAAPQVNF